MKKTFFLALFASGIFLACGGKDDQKGEEIDTKLVNVQTFSNVKVAFGDGFKQSEEGTFTFPTDSEKIRSIKMYIKDICPDKSCDEWDRYANIYVKDKNTQQWYEIGRFITPYWVGTEKLERGLEIDVTDFKSLLSGPTELKIYTETWLAKGRTYSIDFDIQYGKPDYKYSAVVPVFQYNKSSIDGVPYGEAHSFDLSKDIQMTSGIEKAYFRTIISGWGHAQPDNCAEWCFRTHTIDINGTPTYQHELKALGCANNPIDNQSPGNWKPNRAGWCPGMVVPVRIDELSTEMLSSNFNFEYKFKEWTNSNPTNSKAYYAISTFLVVKSNSPIVLPTVVD